MGSHVNGPLSAGRFAGKAVIVMGGASGIGAATAIRFAREGARVIVADIRDVGHRSGTEIGSTGGECHFCRCAL